MPLIGIATLAHSHGFSTTVARCRRGDLCPQLAVPDLPEFHVLPTLDVLELYSRATVLGLAATHQHAESAKSWVLDDNLASIAVSTRLGYRLIDRHHITEHGHRYIESVYQLERDAWLRSPVRHRDSPAIGGVEQLIALLDR